MVRPIGLMLLFVSIVMVGVSYSSRLRDRVKLLKALKELMFSFKRSFSMSRPSFGQLFENDTSQLTSPITSVISERIKAGETPESSAAASLSSPYVKRLLKNEERAFLTGMIVSISQSDISSVIQTLDNACAELDGYIAEASEYAEKNTKIGLAVSIYTALAIVVILM